jgi:uncharacterized membrane protein YvlD (DUF360 family)
MMSVISLLLTAAVLRFTGVLTTTFEVTGWGAAFMGAVVVAVVDFLCVLLWTQLGLETLWWQFWASW